MVLQIVNLSKTFQAAFTAFSSGANWKEFQQLPATGQFVLPMNFGGTPLFVMNNSNPEASPANILAVVSGLESNDGLATPTTVEEVEDISSLLSHSADELETSTQVINGSAQLQADERTVFSTLATFESCLTAENTGDVEITVEARLEQSEQTFRKSISVGQRDHVVPWTTLAGGLLDVTVHAADGGAALVKYKTRHEYAE